MDPTINSLVQSPLVRSLSSVPSKSSAFVHGVKDNVPPFSFQKVEIQPYQQPVGEVGIHKFRVPQFGTLNRAYLRVRYDSGHRDLTRVAWDVQTMGEPVAGSIQLTAAGNEGGNSNLVIQKNSFQTRQTNSSSWNVLHALDQVTLQTHNKVIQCIPGETIPAEVKKMNMGLREFFEKGMAGYAAGTITGGLSTQPQYQVLWDPSAQVLIPNAAGGTSEGRDIIGVHNHADFLVPVTLASTKYLCNNYQTRFTEDLEIHVSTKAFGKGFSDTGAKYYVELVCLFHNWHDNVENSIRQANYKRGIPASIYQHDWVEETKVTNSGSQIEFQLRSPNLCTELWFVVKRASASTRESDYNAGTGFLNLEQHFSVSFSGSGCALWSCNTLELKGPDSCDYDLVDRKANYTDYCGISHERVIPPLNPDFVQTVNNYPTHGGVLLGFGQTGFGMRFGWQTTDEYYTGGIALQTISNPTLVLKNIVDGSDMSVYDVRLYVKYSTLVRIDSDTGVITRTLDV